ncbi:MAG: tRNA 5-methylaminomethyl-2-thiouridine biosynthesis bifunctional protein [Halioglobus sp.]|jgi:tRNA 5-methylaminomethyl-2-thiouridine biosynthesis bifunctional protein
MNRDNHPWGPVTAANIEFTESGTPRSLDFDDYYFNTEDGLDESRYVFLTGNHLPARWQSHSHEHFCIAETGFGTGLNFLLTWQAWRELPEPRPDLHYIGIEQQPLCAADLSRALSLWPSLQPLADQLLETYPGLLPGQHRLVLEQGQLRLDLWWEEAGSALADLAGREQPLIDAWYLDGFTPARNASMWTAALFKDMATLSRQNATFATFTAAGDVRRGLSAVDFAVEKMVGFGKKRECMRGTFGGQPTDVADRDQTPWDRPLRPQARPGHALIVGGGLAGCHAAAALARRGIAVTLLEQGELASRGSGNDQGILYTRISKRHSSLVDFALQSFRFASSLYREMLQTGLLQSGLDGELCGNFQQSVNTAEMNTVADSLHGMESLAQVLDSKQANTLLGIDQPHGGYWYPQSGWLRPASVCATLVQHPNITVVANCGALTLQNDDGEWHAMNEDMCVASAPCAIVAAGTQTAGFEQMNWLPLQAIRGQTTQLPALDNFSGLKAGLCHVGYIAPSRLGQHCIGATFDVTPDDPETLPEDHRVNLNKLGDAVPAWQEVLQNLDSELLDGRVGYRCASPDYLPIVGPAPDYSGFITDYDGLRKDAKRIVPSPGPNLAGLYLSTAHGSRGLTSTAISAELLASMICEEPPPLSRTLCRALHPARFIIRDLSRNRISQ